MHCSLISKGRKYFGIHRINLNCDCDGASYNGPHQWELHMKKLCMVVFNYYDIDSRVKRQAEFVAETGWHVDIIALKSQFNKVPRHNNIKLYELMVAKRRGSFLRYLFQYALFCLWSFFLVSYLHFRNRYSLIQIHNLPDFLVFSALLPRLLQCPVLLDMHEITPEFFRSKYHFRKEHPLVRFVALVEKACIGFSNHVITVNESIRELLISRGIPGKKISTILDSADERIFTLPPPRSHENNNKFVLMYHGTLTQLYGIDVAIRSLSRIREEDRGRIQMRIAGEGPEEESLKKLVDDLGLNDSVKFIGAYPVEEIPQLIGEVDAGICPTTLNELTEHSLSTKLLEYVYMERPIIASRLTTYQKYFDESCLAYFTPGNEKECSEKILSLMSNEELRRTLAANAKARYKDLSWNNVKDRYYNILAGLTGEKGTD